MRLLVFLLLGTLGLIQTAAGQRQLASGIINGEDTSQQLELVSIFDPPPPSGYAPFSIHARNESVNKKQNWDFRFRAESVKFGDSHRGQTQLHFSLPPGTSHRSMVYVPLPLPYGSLSTYSYASDLHTEAVVEVNGSAQRSFPLYEKLDWSLPAVALSQSISAGNGKIFLDEMYRSRTRPTLRHWGSLFRPQDLPEDWRGISGFDFIIMKKVEWDALTAGQRQAVLHWVHFSGHLLLYELAPEPYPHKVETLGAGKIHSLGWDGNKPPLSTMAEIIKRGPKRLLTYTQGYSGSDTGVRGIVPRWNLMKQMGSRGDASGMVILFLLLFGLLVGPINLFVFAPSGKRHRLFFTTPLLSIGASLLLMLIILLVDGTGGKGRRMLFVELRPEEAVASVTQEQFSRAGLLLGSDFEMEKPAVMHLLALPSLPAVKLTSEIQSDFVQVTEEGLHRSGKWFQSRTDQAHLVQAAVATRSRLELKRGGTPSAGPQLLSAMSAPLKKVIYFDEDGKYWQTDQILSSGQVAELKPLEEAAFGKAFAEINEAVGPYLSSMLRIITAKPMARGSFFAVAESAPEFALATHSAIEWEDQVFIFGPVMKP